MLENLNKQKFSYTERTVLLKYLKNLASYESGNYNFGIY